MKKVVTVVSLGLALAAFVLLVLFFMYLKNKKDFYAAAEAYILEPKLESLEKLSASKIPEVVKKKIITEINKKYKCQLAFVTAAIGTVRNKRIITTAELNYCYNNYFSKEEAGKLATTIRKISEGADEYEIFGKTTKIDFETLLASASRHNKLMENASSIDSYFMQIAMKAKEEELRNKPPEPKPVPDSMRTDTSIANGTQNSPNKEQEPPVSNE